MRAQNLLVFGFWLVHLLLTRWAPQKACAAAVDSLSLLVVVNSEYLTNVVRLIKRSSQKLISSNGLVSLELVPMALDSRRNQPQAFEDLCNRLESSGNISSIMSLSKDLHTTFVVTTVAGSLGLPVFGHVPESSWRMFKDVNKFMVDFSPRSKELAKSLTKLLELNFWYSVILVIDGSVSSTMFHRQMAQVISTNIRMRLNVVKVVNVAKIRPSLADFESIPSRIVILHCDSKISKFIMSEAKQYNLMSSRWIWILTDPSTIGMVETQLYNQSHLEGLLAVKADRLLKTRHIFRSLLRVFLRVLNRLNVSDIVHDVTSFNLSCYDSSIPARNLTTQINRRLQIELQDRENGETFNSADYPVFDIFNFVRKRKNSDLSWLKVGNATVSNAVLNSVRWQGGARRPQTATDSAKLRIATAFAPPLVMKSYFMPNSMTCLGGVSCVELSTNKRDQIAFLLADYESHRKLMGLSYNVTCCKGMSIDLLKNIAKDLKFDFTVYVVADGQFGLRKNNSWSGLTGDLISGAAHLAISAFSVTKTREKVIDFSVPFYDTDISCLVIKQYQEVPLAAFLIPFSIDLWITIIASLHVAAIAAAIYEWLSPFGLNPWGRQRTKNFSLASALWVMWSLLFSHLVAFKAPKSWPNKVLINLWGCFSVIFVASYTANIAALFAGLFVQTKINHIHNSFLMTHKVGTMEGSSAEIYIMKENPRLYHKIQRHLAQNTDDGLKQLHSGEMDILIGDTAVLDYYRGWSSTCNLSILGQALYHDSYAIGLQPGFPMKDAISTLLTQYSEIGHIDDLRKKWYGNMPCFERGANIVAPRALSPRKVAGVFMLLSCGFLVGFLILLLEHLVFKYFLPGLRKKAKSSFWKSPNLMFFSQKLYRFINCVELVSPHHSAKEIASNLRAGHIFSLFQKSVKRKAKDDARRRKSKSLFFDMIQEVTRRTKQNELSLDQKSSRKSSYVKNIEKKNQIDMEMTGTEVKTESFSIAEFHEQKSDGDCNEQSRLLQPSIENVAKNTSEFHQITSCGSTRPLSVSLNDFRSASNEQSIIPNVTGPCETLSCAGRILSDSDVLRRKYMETTGTADDNVCQNPSTQPLDPFKLEVMSKQQIMALWMESEMKFKRRLQEISKEKKVLESRLNCLKCFLQKPP